MSARRSAPSQWRGGTEGGARRSEEGRPRAAPPSWRLRNKSAEAAAGPAPGNGLVPLSPLPLLPPGRSPLRAQPQPRPPPRRSVPGPARRGWAAAPRGCSVAASGHCRAQRTGRGALAWGHPGDAGLVGVGESGDSVREASPSPQRFVRCPRGLRCGGCGWRWPGLGAAAAAVGPWVAAEPGAGGASRCYSAVPWALRRCLSVLPGWWLCCCLVRSAVVLNEKRVLRDVLYKWMWCSRMSFFSVNGKCWVMPC